MRNTANAIHERSLYECFVFAGDVVLKDLLIKESALVST